MQASALRQGATIAAIGTAVYAQHLVLVDRGATSTGWLLLAAAAVLAAVAAWTRAPAAPAAALAAERADSRWMRLAWGAGAVAAVAATTILSAKEWWPVLALGLWLGGFALASLAVRGWRVGPQTRPDRRWSPAEVVALGALLALAAAARFAWIHDLPRLYFGDESRVAMFLHNEFGGERFPGLFRMGWNTWPVLGLAVQGIFAPLLGLHISTLRLSSALVGTFAVLSTYLLARALFGTRTALVAAFLLAVNRTAIDFSRLSILHVQVLFIETLAFYFWWRAVNGGRAIHFLWAGIALGFCLFTYNAGQLAPPLLISWMIVCALFAPRVVRSHWRGAALVLFGFFLALFPYLYYFTDGFAFGPNWGQWTIMARNRQTMSRVIEAFARQRLWAGLRHPAPAGVDDVAGLRGPAGRRLRPRLPRRRHARPDRRRPVRPRPRHVRAAAAAPARRLRPLLVAAHGDRRRDHDHRPAVGRAHGRPAAGPGDSCRAAGGLADPHRRQRPAAPGDLGGSRRRPAGRRGVGELAHLLRRLCRAARRSHVRAGALRGDAAVRRQGGAPRQRARPGLPRRVLSDRVSRPRAGRARSVALPSGAPADRLRARRRARADAADARRLRAAPVPRGER